ncbi:MAG: U32 family peptidase [Clostridia bacterium]
MFVCDNNKKVEPYGTNRYWLMPKNGKEGQPEILAPANINTYKYAIFNGADAIYFGIDKFNARAVGENFTTIKEVVEFCHIYGVKAYLALNIIFKNSELEKVTELIIEAENANIDAFIITDLALVKIIKKYSKAEMHASTQMGIHNVAGVKLLEKFGFDRVILSREVNQNDIDYIAKETNIDIEIFVHGALCMGFSGACLMSSILTADSGNRGKCHQLCRKQYTAYYDKKPLCTGFMLSAKDINMLPNINQLKNSKIKSFKIEGRLKRAEYVAGVTKIYKNYIDNEFESIKIEDTNNLKKLFNRGNYCNGYFDNNETAYAYVGSNIGMEYGYVESVIDSHKAIFQTTNKVNKDDGFKILRNEWEIGGATITEVLGNNKAVAYTTKPVQKGDKISITTDTQLNTKLLSVEKKIPVEMAIRLVAGEKPHIFASSSGVIVEFFGEDKIDSADNLPLSTDSIKTQFSRTNNTVFEINFTKIITDNAFIKKSDLNNLRRSVLEKLYNQILIQYKRNESNKKIEKFDKKVEKIEGDFVELESITKFYSIVKEKFNNIVYNPHNLTIENAKEFYNKSKNKNNLVFIKPPIFVNNTNWALLSEIMLVFDGVVANNLSYVYWAIENNKLVVAGYNLNIINSKNPLIEICNQYFVSIEANKRELISFKGAITYTYGNLPLMYLNYCPKKLAGVKCGDCDKPFYLVDEGGDYSLFSQHFANTCNHAVRNGIITSLSNELNNNVKYFDFVDAKRQDIENIIFNYYVQNEFSVVGYNHLHLKRGV